MKERFPRDNFVCLVDGGAQVRLRISPGTKCTGLRGARGDQAIRLALPAPVEGNAEAERSLTARCGVARSVIGVVRGLAGTDKTVFVGGISAREALFGRTG